MALGKQLNDIALVDTTCAGHKVEKERFMEFANILDFKNRR